MKPRVLFIDDDPQMLEVYRRSLESFGSTWDMQFQDSSLAAWDEILAAKVDVVVTDVGMPDLDGIGLLRRMQSDETLKHIPVIVVTSSEDRSLRSEAIDLGASDLLNKPVDHDELVARLRSALRLKACQDELRDHNAQLEDRLRLRTAQLNVSRVDLIWRLAKSAEMHDEETGNHVLRVGCYSRIIAEAMGLDEKFQTMLFHAAPLHDVGKMAISPAILRKPGKLSPTEWEQMQTHCSVGAAILKNDAQLPRICSRWSGMHIPPTTEVFENPLLDMASRIALFHHERWDGSGYPHRLKGERIPLCARIVAVADTFDTMRCLRAYKPAFTLDFTLSAMEGAAGSQFEPQIVEAFRDSLGRILQVEHDFTDARVAQDQEKKLAYVG